VWRLKTSILRHKFVDLIPDQLEGGVLYICERYGTAIHKCFCGCGEEVVTPLSPVEWSLHKMGNKVSLHPSIGNWSFVCRSHYWIRKNRVVWAGALTESQIEYIKDRDKVDREAFIAKMNAQKTARKSVWAKVAAFLRIFWDRVQKN